jgi:hypothetical protein
MFRAVLHKVVHGDTNTGFSTIQLLCVCKILLKRLRSISPSTAPQDPPGVSESNDKNDRLEDHCNRYCAISSTAPETITSKTHYTEGSKPPSRKRSKYSSLPKDIEKALNLIMSHLEDASRSLNCQDDIKAQSQALEQKMRIRER